MIRECRIHVPLRRGRSAFMVARLFRPVRAMGWYPVQSGPDNTPDEVAAIAERVMSGKIEADGWYFLRCPTCHGTGRCSWLTTVARIPRWLIKGAHFCWTMGPNSPAWRGHPFTWRRKAWLTVKVAFLCDLGAKM